ncbi:MAG: shikimate kinase [Caldimonas sp.]
MAPSPIAAIQTDLHRSVVSLIGLPGCGKSAIGKEVARRLEIPFVDSDRVIEGSAGCTIASLFEQEGEAAFREREAAVLASLVAAGPSVVATGGGAVLRSDNRDLLRTRTVCVFLHAGHDQLWRRLRRDRRRPLLQVPDPEARLRALAEEREPLYRETAHIVVATEGLPFGRLVDEVVRRVAAEGER